MSALWTFLSVTAALIRKDIRAELRAPLTVPTLVAFALILLVSFGLALNPVEKDLDDVFAGLYWLGIAFSALIALGRGYGLEREAGTLEALAMLPADRGAVYVAKVAVASLWLLVVTLAMTPLFFVFLDIERQPPVGDWLLVTVMGVLGLVSVGTLLSGVAAHVRGADLLLPLLLLPFSVPVLIAAVRLTEALLQGQKLGAAADWFRLLIAYDIVFFVVSLALFDYVVEV